MTPEREELLGSRLVGRRGWGQWRPTILLSLETIYDESWLPTKRQRTSQSFRHFAEHRNVQGFERFIPDGTNANLAVLFRWKIAMCFFTVLLWDVTAARSLGPTAPPFGSPSYTLPYFCRVVELLFCFLHFLLTAPITPIRASNAHG